MKRLHISFTALALSAVFAISSIVPAEALPIPAAQQHVKQQSDVENVKVIRRNRGWRAPRVNRNRSAWRGNYARNHYRSWRGHRGYSYYRPGYRRYNGWWYPAAAFTTGVIIGTTVYRGGNNHVRWCRNHYVSYRVSDNTYQPYNGPRRVCVSP